MVIRAELAIEPPGRGGPAVGKPEKQVIEAAHHVGAAPILLPQAARPRARVTVAIFLVAAKHGIEVAAENDAGNLIAGEARRVEQVEDGADLAAARILEHPQCVWGAEWLQVRVDQREALY